MEEALIARLRATGPIAALAGARIDWDDRPGELPALTLTMVSPGRSYTLAGADGLDQPRVQIDCWASTKDGRVALARAVLAEMERADDAHGWNFEPAFLEGRLTAREDDEAGGVAVFRETLDFTFYHQGDTA